LLGEGHLLAPAAHPWTLRTISERNCRCDLPYVATATALRTTGQIGQIGLDRRGELHISVDVFEGRKLGSLVVAR
jgi:hypothetical protein